ncbi:NYN domain-containing protein [Corynebacterium yudongzhengii]|uniref:NYN domain-containing protein n=1 Tax=Corynebacterium yudongzhengii TaxID=2080740 RepID=A0A2U1T4D7_9CORY|nr:NYN domain-containing protein [Corynebacterium yudongzhengii]AWB82823.1 NYN domain-containing protein [Corynebacterium yudongzhengii]PWC00861.1 NYN domain-containing protein [Corynebacterium yudongzhengii]
MLERTTVFVDTSYLLASFYNSWETGARSQLEIDLPEVVAVLGNMIKEQLGQPIHRQNWYDGIPDSGPHRYQRSLRSCDGVQLRTGQLIEWGERRTQKGVDTRLVADMVITGYRREVSDIVLVSGDADMIPGVQEATHHGVRVHLYGFGWDSMSSALRHACDSTTILDPREDFADAMQLQVLEGPLPPSIRERPIDDAEPVEDPGMTPVPAGSPLHPETPTAQYDSTAAEPPVSSEERPAEDAATPQTPSAQQPPAAAGEAKVKKSDEVSEPNDEPTEAEAEIAKQKSTPKPSPANMNRTSSAPKPSMMAPRRKLRSRYVPLPEEVWTSAGFQTPFDVGQQYATWWFDNAATSHQRDSAHLLSGGGLPPEIDRPLLQFACETLHEYTLSENQRVNLRDGFHSGIRGVLININRTD